MSGTVHLLCCSFLNNGARGGGGALFSDFLVGHINSCIFDNNQGSKGGAIQIKSLSGKENENLLVVQNCTFARNSASSFGGGLSLEGLSTNLSRSNLSGNMASSGSAIYFSGSLHRLDLILCNIAENSGHALLRESVMSETILVYDSDAVTASHVNFHGNVGAVLVLGDARAEVYDCSFHNNFCPYLVGTEGFSSLLLIRNTSFVNNSGEGSVLSLWNLRTLIQNCRFVVNNFTKTTIAMFGDSKTELRLYRSTFIAPKFMLHHQQIIVYLKYVAKNPLTSVTLYYWNTTVQCGCSETLQKDTKSQPKANISIFATHDYVYWTQKSSPFASGVFYLLLPHCGDDEFICAKDKNASEAVS